MSKQIEKAMRNSSQYQQQFLGLMKPLTNDGYRISDLFRDFCALSHYSLQQCVEKLVNHEISTEVEAQYLALIGKYNRKAQLAFPEMLACVVMGLEEKPFDFLGELYTRLEIGNFDKGQYFTPAPIMQLMLQTTLGDAQAIIDQQGYLSLSDPCCGSGGAFIYAADTLYLKGINYQKYLLCLGTDSDITACQMSYIQCSLLAIPARIELGDGLANQREAYWYTLQYYLSGMYKLSEQDVQMEASAEPKQSEMFV